MKNMLFTNLLMINVPRPIFMTHTSLRAYVDGEEDKVLYANTKGAIDRSQGWKLVNGSRYYVKANGEAARDEFITVGGKRYYMDSEGIMQSGNFYVWDGEKSYEYYTDNSGVIITNNWYWISWNGILQITKEYS